MFLVSAEFLRLIVIRFQVGDDDDTSSVGTVSQIVIVEEHDLPVVVSFFFFADYNLTVVFLLSIFAITRAVGR